jgi:hypothetical protein
MALAATVVLGLGIVITAQLERPDLTPPTTQPLPAAPRGGPLPQPAPTGAAPYAPAPQPAAPAKLDAMPAGQPETQAQEGAPDQTGEALKLKKAQEPAKRESRRKEVETAAARNLDHATDEQARRSTLAGAPAAPVAAQASEKRDQETPGRSAGAGSNFGLRGTEDTLAPPAADKALGGALGAGADAARATDQAKTSAMAKPAPPASTKFQGPAAPSDLAAPPAPMAMAPMAAPPPPPAAPAQAAGRPYSRSADAAPPAAQREAAPATVGVAGPAPAVRPLDESNPDLWARRIGDLRRAGLQAQADIELKRLRERYPDFKLPPEALPPVPAAAPPP